MHHVYQLMNSREPTEDKEIQEMQPVIFYFLKLSVLKHLVLPSTGSTTEKVNVCYGCR